MTSRLLIIPIAAQFWCTSFGCTTQPSNEPQARDVRAPSAAASVPDAVPSLAKAGRPLSPLTTGLSAALSVRDWAGAVDYHRKLSAAQKREPAVRYGYAYALHKLGSPDQGLASIEGLEKDLPLLASEIEALRFEGELVGASPGRAAAYLEKLGDAQSLYRAARALAREGDKPRALPLISSAIKASDAKKQTRLVAALRRLRVSLLDKTKQRSLLQSDLRWLALAAASFDAAGQADIELEQVSKQALNKAQRLERAKQFSEAGDPDAVAAELLKLEKAPGSEIPIGELLRTRAFAHYNKRDYARAAEFFEQAAKLKTKYLVKDTFYAARALARANQDDEALARYKQIIKKHPRSGFAEHAAYLIGHTELSLGRFNACAKSLNWYLGNYKQGRFAKSARRELAVARLATGAHRKAAVGFGYLLDREKSPDLAARYRQLYAVALSGAGKKKQALIEFARVAKERPLSLAAGFARLRLEALGEKPPPSWSTPPAAAPWQVPLPEKAALFGRIGVHIEAAAELTNHEDALKAKYKPRSYEALCSVYGALQEGARRYQVGQLAARYRFLTEPPTEKTRWLWDCIYPRPFTSLVEGTEREYSLPPHLMYAVMRQESAFKVSAESWASASGLMQMIEPTARRVAAELGETFDTKTRYNPPQNVRFGGHYLKVLREMFRGNLALSLAAYNAGPHAVTRWLEAGEKLPLDIFVASIPYAETRGYVHRVLANLMRYAFLGGDPQPKLELEIEKGMRAPPDAY